MCMHLQIYYTNPPFGMMLGLWARRYVFNTFAFGYAIGYHFIERGTGSMNGNFLGIGADLMVNASVQVHVSMTYTSNIAYKCVRVAHESAYI